MIFALYRAQRILSGAVEDPAGLNDLMSLLAEWPERCSEALELIRHYSKFATISAGKPSEVASDYVLAVSALRWRETEHPERKAGAAQDALNALGKEIENLSGLSLEKVRELHEKARKLAGAVSDLSLDAIPIH